MTMNYGRSWRQWFLMHWVVGATVVIQDSDIRQFRFQSTRWFLLAYIHMIYIQQKLEKEYSGCRVITWMDWEE